MKALEAWWFEFTFYPWMAIALWIGVLAILGVLVFRGTTIEPCVRNGHHARLNSWKTRQRKGDES